MSSNQYLKTDRLTLKVIEETDSQFILKLVNTNGWVTFIGDRNVHDNHEAINYIKKIVFDDKITYWIVQLLDQTKIGIITLIKREYLQHYDIGFAFLPDFQGNGYAYEASKAVLNHLINTTDYQTILATTIPSNTSSIKLIEKLGLTFYKTDLQQNKELSLYSLDLDKLKIDKVIKKFFSAFTNNGIKPRLNLVYDTCLDAAILLKNTNGMCEVYDLQSFITPRAELLTNGTLQNFEEYEVDEKTVITRNIAQRFSQYQKEGILNGNHFSEKGSKMFQMVKVNTAWKICNVIWDDE